MANYFRKRRPKPSPNKNEEKVRRAVAQKRLDSLIGTLAEHYPTVTRLALDVKFLSPQSLILDQQVLDFSPNSDCRFTFPCAGRCGKGAFDLTAIITQVVNSKKKLDESSRKCEERIYVGSSEACGCEMQYKINITYAPPKPEPKPPPAA